MSTSSLPLGSYKSNQDQIVQTGEFFAWLMVDQIWLIYFKQIGSWKKFKACKQLPYPAPPKRKADGSTVNTICWAQSAQHSVPEFPGSISQDHSTFLRSIRGRVAYCGLTKHILHRHFIAFTTRKIVIYLEIK